ncbi:hypothetical protein [Paenibacillus sp. GP183]|uniref:hypothetical protein n=1 Tax=Paenibacillus sp. GP183 TaxID=1882751 RepID=UPI00089602C5|nr:hypothetical protein [Paenibacillus sp. GP183]SEC18516.1 hypothetical protein SAMN05443246_3261 [Paenibacillus sp. GP183]
MNVIIKFRVGSGNASAGILQLWVEQREKLSNFDAYGLDAEYMDFVIRYGVKTIELYVHDSGGVYSIDVDTFKKFAEVRSIGNEPRYCCPLSHWEIVLLPNKGVGDNDPFHP